MPAPGWGTVNVREELLAEVDKFVSANRHGFAGRSDVTAAALRAFLQAEAGQSGPAADARTRAVVHSVFKGVDAAAPSNVKALIDAVLAETDLELAAGEVPSSKPSKPWRKR